MSTMGPVGLVAIAARVTEIQGRIAALQTGRVGSTGAASGVLGASALGATSSSFSDVLAGAVSDLDGTSGVGTAASTGTALTADGVPAALAAYGNGKVPASALSSIGHGDHRLWAPAATAFGRLEQAAARDGVTIGVTDSYRSYDAQVDLAARKGLYSQGGLAAKPGTSDHGWGMALDLDLDARAQAWMRANASRFGFTEDTPREPWHWGFTPTA